MFWEDRKVVRAGWHGRGATGRDTDEMTHQGSDLGRELSTQTEEKGHISETKEQGLEGGSSFQERKEHLVDSHLARLLGQVRVV